MVMENFLKGLKHDFLEEMKHDFKILVIFIIGFSAFFSFLFLIGGVRADSSYFGNKDAGAVGTGAGYIACANFTLADTANVSIITVYGKTATAGGTKISGGIYNGTSRSGLILRAKNTTVRYVAQNNLTWHTIPLNYSILSPGIYWLCIAPNGTTFSPYYNTSVSTTELWKNTTIYSMVPLLGLTTRNSAYMMSVYVNYTYTVVADSTPPIITNQSPSNTTYYKNWFWANITGNENLNWCGYSLNGSANVTMSNTSMTAWYKNVTGVNDGYKNITFSCNDTIGNMNSSVPYTYFTVYTVPPGFVSLNTAGNPNENQFGTDTTSRYYRNSTWQKEDWMYINITTNGSADTAFVEWKNSSAWKNYTMTKSNGNYYLNITGQPSYGAYTFNIWLNGSEGTPMTNVYNWTFYDYKTYFSETKEQWRKYTGLNGTPAAFSYKNLYMYNKTYTVDYTLDRILSHEQPTDGTINDTGKMLATKPTQNQERNCMHFVGFPIEETYTVNDTDLVDMYVHVWWDTDNDDPDIELGYEVVMDNNMTMNMVGTNFTADINTAKKNATISGFSQPTYHLEATYWNMTDVKVGDNNISLFTFKGHNQNDNPSIISTGNYSSFIILNVPDNATLAGLNSDADTLNDFVELYTKYTDPFDPDTDGDGVNDNVDADPLDPTNTTSTEPSDCWTDYPATNLTFIPTGCLYKVEGVLWRIGD